MSLSKKGGRTPSHIASPVDLGVVSSKYSGGPPSASRPKRSAPPSNNGDLVLDIAGHYDGEHHRSNNNRRKKKKKYYSHSGANCGGWLPWINTTFVLVLTIFMLVMYLNWNGAGGEITLARLEGDSPPLMGLIPKPMGLIDDLRHAMHNHSQRIEFSVNAIPGQFSRYPEEGKYIKGLDPYTLIEHRLCCHINGHMFICDYGQGASKNVALECMVEYTKQGSAFLKIYIQSEEMSGAKCSFNWITSEPKEVLETGKKIELDLE